MVRWWSCTGGLAVLLSISTTAAQPPGGPPPFGPGGFGPGGFGGPAGQKRKLVQQFDKDGDGRLNATERKAALRLSQEGSPDRTGRLRPRQTGRLRSGQPPDKAAAGSTRRQQGRQDQQGGTDGRRQKVLYPLRQGQEGLPQTGPDRREYQSPPAATAWLPRRRLPSLRSGQLPRRSHRAPGRRQQGRQGDTRRVDRRRRRPVRGSRQA